MTDITSEQRAAWAAKALLQYAIDKEGGEELYDEAELVLSDLLADLRHYAARESIDFKTCIDRAEMHYDAEVAEESGNQFGSRCPKCGKADEIDIAATVWVRLCPDGTDVTQAANGDHEWEDSSPVKCCACGHDGTVASFQRRPK